MNYAAHAAAAAPPPTADPHPTYAHPYGYPYTYPAYHQPDPPAAAAHADPSSASSSSYYYSNPTAPADAQAQYNPYANTYHYYDPSAVPYGGGGHGLAGCYFSAGEASQAPAVSAPQAAPAPTARDAGKHLGFDPQRYAQVSALTAFDLLQMSSQVW
jgi:hypothetical protein